MRLRQLRADRIVPFCFPVFKVGLDYRKLRIAFSATAASGGTIP